MSKMHYHISIVIVLIMCAVCTPFRLHSNNNNRVHIRNTKLHGTNDIPIFGVEWAKLRGMVPGYGGIWPGNPDAKKYRVTVKSKKTGEVFITEVPNDRYIYFSFEEQGIDLPVINKARMCRQGCCTICTAKIESGTVKMDAPLGLLKDFRDQGYALTCCSYPTSDIVCELQDEDEMFIRQWSEGFEGGGKEWGKNDEQAASSW